MGLIYGAYAMAEQDGTPLPEPVLLATTTVYETRRVVVADTAVAGRSFSVSYTRSAEGPWSVASVQRDQQSTDEDGNLIGHERHQIAWTRHGESDSDLPDWLARLIEENRPRDPRLNATVGDPSEWLKLGDREVGRMSPDADELLVRVETLILCPECKVGVPRSEATGHICWHCGS